MSKAIPLVPELRERLLAKIVQSGDCWNWHGTRDPRGYGILHMHREKYMAHRASYTAFVAPIPDGLVLDHLCRNTSCVNPAHLEPVAQRTNLLRGESPMAKAVRTGKCKRGHSRAIHYVENRDGTGRCKQCANEVRLAREAANPHLREARLEWLREYGKRRVRHSA